MTQSRQAGTVFRLPTILPVWVLPAIVTLTTAAVVLVRLRSDETDSGYSLANLVAGAMLAILAGWHLLADARAREVAAILVVLGIGQFGAGVEALIGPARFPTGFEVAAALVSIPLVLYTYLRYARVGASGLISYVVFGVECLTMGLVVLYWAWHLGLDQVLMTGEYPMAAFVLTSYCVNAGCLFVLLLRVPGRAAGRLVIGSVVLLVGHISTARAAIEAGTSVQPLLITFAFACYASALWRSDEIWHPSPHQASSGPGYGLRRRAIVVVAGLSVPVGVYLKSRVGEAEQVTATGFVLVSLVLICLAVRELVRVEETLHVWRRMRTQAREHALTRLGNRRALQETLTSAAGRQDTLLFVIDLDRFREFNGRHGQRVGDKVLLAVSMGLRDIGPDVSAYCMEGNEFAVVAPGRAERINEMAKRIQQIVRSYTEVLAGVQHTFTATIGVAAMPCVRLPRQRGSYDDLHHEGPVGPEQVLEQAEYALSVAQETQADVCVYSEDLRVAAQRRSQLERRLRQALRNGNITPHFQPIVEMATGTVRGLEALARWTDDQLGTVGPGEFIPVAEHSGLIGELGHVMLDGAVQMAGWLRGSAEDVYVSVNVSPLQLSDPGFAAKVRECLHRHNARPADVVLEVTEGIFVDRDSQATQVLADLASTGVRIALDDFGSGYSSLGYMSRLPVQMIKIDRSLVTQVHEDRPRAVLDGILNLCRNLELTAVVEGVETAADNKALMQIGATYGQGWLWSRAVPPQEIPALINSRSGIVVGPAVSTA